MTAINICECCFKVGVVDSDGQCTHCGHAANVDMGPECPGNPYHIPEDDDEVLHPDDERSDGQWPAAFGGSDHSSPHRGAPGVGAWNIDDAAIVAAREIGPEATVRNTSEAYGPLRDLLPHVPTDVGVALVYAVASAGSPWPEMVTFLGWFRRHLLNTDPRRAVAVDLEDTDEGWRLLARLEQGGWVDVRFPSGQRFVKSESAALDQGAAAIACEFGVRVSGWRQLGVRFPARVRRDP